jgi:DNA-binding GntR family transcriptional regulator
VNLGVPEGRPPLIDYDRCTLVPTGSTQLTLRRSGSRAQALYERLREDILSGVLKPGDRLVEQEVAHAANVSRTPVREALQRLESDGLVAEGGGGLEVRAISREELTERCAVREILEGMATELAAGAASSMEIAAIQGIFEQEVKAIEEEAPPAVHVELNRAFHDAIWDASHNRYLRGLLLELRERLAQLQDTTLRDESRREAALEEHREIVEALANHDRAAAGEAARAHFRNAMALRLRMTK